MFSKKSRGDPSKPSFEPLEKAAINSFRRAKLFCISIFFRGYNKNTFLSWSTRPNRSQKPTYNETFFVWYLWVWNNWISIIILCDFQMGIMWALKIIVDHKSCTMFTVASQCEKSWYADGVWVSLRKHNKRDLKLLIWIIKETIDNYVMFWDCYD